ncbi:hypothetical protein DAPPUDRAFT_335371 [Daphnia pulex]|uniref:Uncharacterized protein n=1 Tax=Daphnia pulex TaxID=6669 RepID=E9HXL8_DAPPU|nr:hypothetical protein DAPPUDRAFT_335371 [Daphnia pulex]|eukprot:EFX63515.1 hypothetical protein DAPPUDRAFT_335371 [Daphnia pulex]
MPGWKVGYMNNHPGDLNGKIAYYVALLKDPENAGIPPTDVIFMSYGVNIISDTEYGVDPNFTIFNVQILLKKILEITYQTTDQHVLFNTRVGVSFKQFKNSEIWRMKLRRYGYIEAQHIQYTNINPSQLPHVKQVNMLLNLFPFFVLLPVNTKYSKRSLRSINNYVIKTAIEIALLLPMRRLCA